MSSFMFLKLVLWLTLNMVLGFGGFIGAGLRSAMYKPYKKCGKHWIYYNRDDSYFYAFWNQSIVDFVRVLSVLGPSVVMLIIKSFIIH